MELFSLTLEHSYCQHYASECFEHLSVLPGTLVERFKCLHFTCRAAACNLSAIKTWSVIASIEARMVNHGCVFHMLLLVGYST